MPIADPSLGSNYTYVWTSSIGTVWPYTFPNVQTPCPTCGHCPTCGAFKPVQLGTISTSGTLDASSTGTLTVTNASYEDTPSE